MAGLAKMILIGHLGRDPVLNYTDAGLAIATFSVAVSEKVKNEDKTQWFKIIAFGKLAEICGEYLTKGKQVYVEGRFQMSEWETKSGEKRFTAEIIANTMQMLGSKGDQQQPATNNNQQQQLTADPAPPGPIGDDDIPF